MRTIIILLTMLILIQETAASGRNWCSKHNCQKLFIEDQYLCMDCLDEDTHSTDEPEPPAATEYSQSVQESGEDTSFEHTSFLIAYATNLGIQVHPAMLKLAELKKEVIQRGSKPVLTTTPDKSALKVSPPQAIKNTNPQFSSIERWIRENTNACEDDCRQYYPHKIVDTLKQYADSPTFDDLLTQIDVYWTPATDTNMMAFLNDHNTVVILVTVITDESVSFFVTLVPVSSSGIVLSVGNVHFQIIQAEVTVFLDWLTHNRSFRCQAYITSRKKHQQ